MTISLAPKHLAIVRAIAQQYLPEHQVCVFGSRANGKARQYSDLDLLLDGEPINIGKMAALKEAFSESDLPILVDIVQKKNISDAFYQAIKKDLVPLSNE